MCGETIGLFGQRELAIFLGVSQRTLERWRSEQLGPPYIAALKGGTIRYRKSDVEAWLEAQVVRPTRPCKPVLGSKGIRDRWSARRRE